MNLQVSAELLPCGEPLGTLCALVHAAIRVPVPRVEIQRHRRPEHAVARRARQRRPLADHVDDRCVPLEVRL